MLHQFSHRYFCTNNTSKYIPVCPGVSIRGAGRGPEPVRQDGDEAVDQAAGAEGQVAGGDQVVAGRDQQPTEPSGKPLIGGDQSSVLHAAGQWSLLTQGQGQ